MRDGFFISLILLYNCLTKAYVTRTTLSVSRAWLKRRPSASSLYMEYTRISFNDYKNDAIGFLKAVKRRSKEIEKFSSLDAVERKGLTDLLHTHCAHLDASSMSSLVFSLGLFGHAFQESKICVQNFNADIVGSLNAYEMGNILVGFGRMGADWSSFKAKEKIYSRISKLLQHMDEKSVSDTLYALGLLNARWSEFPRHLQESILSALSKCIPKLNSFSISSILWSFAKLGFKWNDFPIELQKSLPARLASQHNDMSPQQSSKSVWALGTMGVHHRSLPLGFLDFHIENVNTIKRSQMGYAIPASQTLTGIAKTGIVWEEASVKMKASIWEQLMRVCQSTNNKGIANAVWAVGTIGAPEELQPLAVKESMFNGILRVADDCTSWALCNLLWGLSKMGYRWNELSPALQNSLMRNIKRIENEMNYLDSSILVLSLGTLRAPLDTLPRDFMESVFASTERTLYETRAQECSNVIWGLSQSGLSWDGLPFKVQWAINAALRRLGEGMGLQDVGHCAYGLSILAFDSSSTEEAALRGAHQAVLAAIRSALKGSVNLRSGELMEEMEQLRIYAHYLSVNQLVGGDVHLIPSILLDVSNTRSSYSSSTNMKSKLQDRVIQGVRDAFSSLSTDGHPSDYQVIAETSSFGGAFPVDASVLYKGKVVALLEVDGPSHYRFDGKLKRKDKLKEAMYRKKHPRSTFHRIRFDSENKIGAEAIGMEIMETIVRSQRADNPVEGWFRDRIIDAKQFIDSGFVWSLRNSPPSIKNTK